MKDFLIVTDMNSDIMPDVAQSLGVRVLPMPYIMDDVAYENKLGDPGIDIKEFYNLIRAGKLATTIQRNPTEYEELFSNLLSEGKDVLYLCFSAALSGSYTSAKLAEKEINAKFKENKLIVLDSECMSLGLALLTYHTVMKKREGLSIDEVANWVLENRKKLVHIVAVDDLFHFMRGGRVSATAAVVGSALGIKPILHIDDKGALVPTNKVRGRRQSLDFLVKTMEERTIDPGKQVVFICHSDCEEDAKYVANEIRKRWGNKEIYIGYIGPVIGSHTGTGTVSLFFMGNYK
ncbi:MAG: DegV family protein [Bacillota bacterium]|nr:DegV family protein [Bacillota bacterium]